MLILTLTGVRRFVCDRAAPRFEPRQWRRDHSPQCEPWVGGTSHTANPGGGDRTRERRRWHVRRIDPAGGTAPAGARRVHVASHSCRRYHGCSSRRTGLVPRRPEILPAPTATSPSRRRFPGRRVKTVPSHAADGGIVPLGRTRQDG